MVGATPLVKLWLSATELILVDLAFAVSLSTFNVGSRSFIR